MRLETYRTKAQRLAEQARSDRGTGAPARGGERSAQALALIDAGRAALLAELEALDAVKVRILKDDAEAQRRKAEMAGWLAEKTGEKA